MCCRVRDQFVFDSAAGFVTPIYLRIKGMLRDTAVVCRTFVCRTFDSNSNRTATTARVISAVLATAVQRYCCVEYLVSAFLCRVVSCV